ncbi:vacuolar protein sorting-associated protein 62-like [Iris pallida]|uniref:Vacuolar protein sorting-associated protein 62-like n=1 Tax=Iris pallida TaxID=29817 RepID=A0AAX6EPF9_IRIPA|nr:vacuolar protein sorting-associated protein 62-like [Iris pallida]
MDGWNWWRCFFCWSRGRGILYDRFPVEPEPFSLPSPIPQWPKGQGFAKGSIHIGELEIAEVTKFQSIWSCHQGKDKSKGATFYKPVGIPDGFFCLGHYGQPVDQPLRGFLLVAREVSASNPAGLPALHKPLDYTLVWSSYVWKEDSHGGYGYFWLPCPPEGYKAVGYLVTKGPDKPSLEEVRCVRADLTDTCEAHGLIFNAESSSSDTPFLVWKTRPSLRGIWGRGISTGTFICGSSKDDTSISCLKNLDSSLHAMPNLDQVHSLIKHYGPTVFFHPKEAYLPSSVSWFFKSGASLFKAGGVEGEAIDAKGSNLPCGGENDREYWIDLPDDERNDYVKHGNMESAELYVHVKPALGGIFTDIAMWVFCPFNGPATLKFGLASIPLGKIGQHVGDWEHFTLRISNFTGELWSIYFSQHSGGEWVDAHCLEYIEGNRAIVYSSKSGHASFPHPGIYLQGSRKLGIGIRNDAARSKLVVDSSSRYQIVAAEYLGDAVTEPNWLQYMREWGPTIRYNSRSELEKFLRLLPVNLRFSVETIFDKLPLELYGEEGPTGPKEKNNWVGDERW